MAFVTGIDAGERGQDVVAAIALRPGETLDEDEARKRVKEEIASYKVPRHIAVFADQTELPVARLGQDRPAPAHRHPRGTVPGRLMRFDPYSTEFFEDPWDVYRWLRDEAPVYFDEELGFYAVSRYEDCVEVHRDVATYTSTQRRVARPAPQQRLRPGDDRQRVDHHAGPARCTTGCASW